MELEEFSMLYSSYIAKQKEEYQMQVYVISAGVASAMSGTSVQLFDEDSAVEEPKERKGTQEYRDNTLKELKKLLD